MFQDSEEVVLENDIISTRNLSEERKRGLILSIGSIICFLISFVYIFFIADYDFLHPVYLFSIILFIGPFPVFYIGIKTIKMSKSLLNIFFTKDYLILERLFKDTENQRLELP